MNEKLSIIAVVRNDNYGLHYEQRLISFFKSIEECEYNIQLVLTEWNPPTDRKNFYEEYKDILPKNTSVKIVTVPNEIHKNLENSNLFSVFEYIGKNVGAIHASGDYLLFTNPDNIFVKELWDKIFVDLDQHHFLRVARTDLYFKDIDYKSLNVNDIINNLQIMNSWWYNGSGELFTDASGDFLCVSKNNFYKICGYDELFTYSNIDSMFLKKLNNYGIKQKVLEGCTYHIDHARPHMATAQAHNLITDWISTPHTFNENWGLQHINLEVKEYKF